MTQQVKFEYQVKPLGLLLEVEASVQLGRAARHPADATSSTVTELSVDLVGDPDNLELDEDNLKAVFLLDDLRRKVSLYDLISDVAMEKAAHHA